MFFQCENQSHVGGAHVVRHDVPANQMFMLLRAGAALPLQMAIKEFTGLVDVV